MTDERTPDEKLAAYREKYPERVIALRKLILPMLGHVAMKSTLSPEAVALVCQPVEDRIIRVVFGIDA